jgi:hypothetical protein
VAPDNQKKAEDTKMTESKAGTRREKAHTAASFMEMNDEEMKSETHDMSGTKSDVGKRKRDGSNGRRQPDVEKTENTASVTRKTAEGRMCNLLQQLSNSK